MSFAFCREFPERIRGLLIIDTEPGFKNDEARVAWNRQAIGDARHAVDIDQCNRFNQSVIEFLDENAL